MPENWLPPVDFPAYLESKRAIDAASLNPALFERFRTRCETHPALRLLDLGTGTGAMLRCVLDFRLGDAVELAGLDQDPVSLESAAGRIGADLESRGFRVRYHTTPGRWELEAEDAGKRWMARLVQGDFLAAAADASFGLGDCDVVTAHAFLDLLPAERGLRAIRSLLRPKGMLYATLNYDGQTALLPPDRDERFERALLAAYDQSMEDRRVGGEPTAGALSGRRLYGALGPAGFEVLGAGSSDWNVFPRAGGDAEGGWAEGGGAEGAGLFMKVLLGMIASEGLRSKAIDPRDLRGWHERRCAEVDAGRLGLVVHQLDLLAERSP